MLEETNISRRKTVLEKDENIPVQLQVEYPEYRQSMDEMERIWELANLTLARRGGGAILSVRVIRLSFQCDGGGSC